MKSVPWTWGASHEDVSTRRRGACSDNRGTCVGSGYAGSTTFPPVVYYDWSGAYIGFNAGGVWTQVDQNSPNRRSSVALDPEMGKASRPAPAMEIFGFHAGAQWQWGAWVCSVSHDLAHTGRHRVGVDDAFDRVAPVVGISGFESARGGKGALTGCGPEREVSYARQSLEAKPAAACVAHARSHREGRQGSSPSACSDRR